jgi:CHASE2 domain-containing sensor protein/signal transduction histidine kinase
MEHERFFNLFVGLGLTLGIWVASLAGFFSIPNGLVYDFFLRSAPQERQPSQVLLVLADYHTRDMGDDVWLHTITTLEDLGARQVIFSFLPTNVSRSFYEAAEKKSTVFLGRQKLRELEQMDTPTFEAIPRQAVGLHLPIGLLGLDESSHGINRTEKTAWSIGKQSQDSVILMAARERLGILPDLGQDFPINFAGRPGGIPKTDLSSVLNKTLVSEMVQGRSVLVGFRVPNRFSGVLTPLNPYRPSMTPVEYHGFALDTLISGRTIMWLGGGPSLVLIGSVVALGLLLHNLVASRLAMTFVIAFIALCSVAVGVLFFSVGLWLPILELITSQLVLVAAMAWRRTSERDEKVREFFLEKSARVMLGSVPGTIFDSPDHWNQLVHMVNQTLPLAKTIFLEKIPGDHRVKEVAALNTGLSDIEERRRDYERTPYATALERGIPVKVSKFFKSASETEEQFLVPLSFGGTILGFWAFTVESEQPIDPAKLFPAISMFSSQFAELLYRRREWRESEKVQQSWFNKILALKRRQDMVDRMVDLVTLLELRLALLESALESSGSALMLCDLFGRVLAVNKRMKDLCGRVGVVPYQLTALDVLVRLTGKTPTETRTIINRAILETDTLNVSVTVSANGIESFFFMTVSGLKSQSTQILHSEDKERYPFDLYGLLIEMQEVSERADVTRVKDRILEQGSIRIQEGLETLISLITVLEEQAPSTSMTPVLQRIRFTRSSLSAAMDELRSYIREDGFSSTIDYYPVDAAEPVTAAVVSLQRDMASRSVTVEVDEPSSKVLVLGMPQELAQLIEALLRILVKDAYEGTQISVKIIPRGLEVVYELANSGYGIPDEDFQRYLTSPELAESEQFETIGRLRSNLVLWRADLTGSSEVGRGMRFTLRLIRSLLSS